MPTARSPAVAAPTASSGGGDRQALLAALLATLVVASWAVLWLWSASPYGRYLGHGGWGDAGALAALCRAVPMGAIAVPALLHALAWVLMIAAMMLPTTIPLLVMVRRVTAARPDARRLVALVATGYFLAWLGFGLVAHGADALLQWGAGHYPWFIENGWIVGAAVLAGAGMFQWSALKYRCLDQCRAPFGFVAARWHGRSPSREAFRIGVDHGLFCVGCCWALMLTMFVVGIGSIGWMLALAAVMAAEKNLPWGRHLATPVGVALLGWSAAVVVAHV
jgi:predicted metal-binding membrane protein